MNLQVPASQECTAQWIKLAYENLSNDLVHTQHICDFQQNKKQKL
jgi:hypothetical protein